MPLPVILQSLNTKPFASLGSVLPCAVIIPTIPGPSAPPSTDIEHFCTHKIKEENQYIMTLVFYRSFSFRWARSHSNYQTTIQFMDRWLLHVTLNSDNGRISTHLIHWLACTKDEINSSLNATTLEVVSTFIIPQRILQAIESTAVKERFVSADSRRSSRNPRVFLIHRVVVWVLFQKPSIKSNTGNVLKFPFS